MALGEFLQGFSLLGFPIRENLLLVDHDVIDHGRDFRHRLGLGLKNKFCSGDGLGQFLRVGKKSKRLLVGPVPGFAQNEMPDGQLRGLDLYGVLGLTDDLNGRTGASFELRNGQQMS